MAGKQGNQQYNNGKRQVPRSVSEFWTSNSQMEVDLEMSSDMDYRAVFGVGDIRGIGEMECIHSLGAEIFRRRGWNSKVSPDSGETRTGCGSSRGQRRWSHINYFIMTLFHIM